MNDNPGLNPNTDCMTPRQADDALRTVVFESVATSDRQATHGLPWSLNRESAVAVRNTTYRCNLRRIAPVIGLALWSSIISVRSTELKVCPNKVGVRASKLKHHRRPKYH